jgi:hypothetical protein
VHTAPQRPQAFRDNVGRPAFSRSLAACTCAQQRLLQYSIGFRGRSRGSTKTASQRGFRQIFGGWLANLSIPR